MSLGPFDLTGEPFLILYISLLSGVLIAALITPTILRSPGRWQTVSDEDELAYLSGGASRFAEAVTTRLLAAGALVMSDKTIFTVDRAATTAVGVEADVLRLPSPLEWKRLKQELETRVGPVKRRLIAAGLVMDHADTRRVWFWVVTPFLALLAFGAIKLGIGLMRDRPVGFLAILMAITTICMFLAANIKPLTKAGRDVLAAARRDADRLQVAPTTAEVGLAVALFGPVVLAGSGWDAFYRLGKGDSGGSGDGGGDGGGGDGGGGCGGCGG